MAKQTPSRLPAPTIAQFRPHPWHGLPGRTERPDVVHVFIEITPFDLVKYELDKVSGFLKVDRPQRTSSQPPALYGFVPRTWCGNRVSVLSPEAERGDGDPLDICVLSERAITRGEVLLRARVVGGLQMVDGGEADDKLIAVLENDWVWGRARDLKDLPPVLVERLQHYFLTYKALPGKPSESRITRVYSRARARKVLEAAFEDYVEEYGP